VITKKRASILAGLLGLLGLAAGLAFASAPLPAPTITSHPSNPTAATSAGFAFTDSLAGAKFACSLDGSAYTPCSSPEFYSGLAAGTHTFAVEALPKGGGTSSPASYSWTVDLTPPTIAIQRPAAGASYNAAGWNAACPTGPAACGTATDPSGVSDVTVSIEQNSSGRYWTGSGYTSHQELYWSATVSRSGSWFYRLPLPAPDGTYTLRVRATDGVGNRTPATSPATAAFTIDTIPPPAPTITYAPPNPSYSTGAAFAFADTEPGVTFSCQLDGGAWQSCRSPATFTLAAGSHTFRVRAGDAAGNVSAATSYTWVIQVGTNFTISSSTVGPLYPGAPAKTVVVTLSNPNSVPIYVTALSAAVVTGSLPAGCPSSWFQLTQSNLSSTQPVQIPSGGSVTLPAQGVSAPALQMIDSHTNQDACENAGFTLSFSGSAHS
jgi:hypothetical protein